MGPIQAIRESMGEFEQTPESYGLTLRLNLAEIVNRWLQEHPEYQARDLAARSDLECFTIEAIIHAECNYGIDTVARVLHAMGLKGRLVVDE